MAERIEIVRSEPLQELRTQIQEPLSRWAQSTRWVGDFNEDFYKPGGPFETITNTLAQASMEGIQNLTGKFSPAMMAQNLSMIRHTLAFQERTGEISSSALNAVTHHSIRAKMAMGPEVKRKMDDAQKQYEQLRQALAPHKKTVGLTGPLIENAVAETFQKHPEVLYDLPSVLTINDAYAIDLATFIANTKRTDLIPSTIRRLALENNERPNPVMLNRFLEDMATQHYNKKPDGLWEILELALNLNPAMVKEAFVIRNPNEGQIKNDLIAQLVSRLMQRDHLPQPLRERFAVFVDRQTTELLATINKLTSPFKIIDHNPRLEEERDRSIGYKKKLRPSNGNEIESKGEADQAPAPEAPTATMLVLFYNHDQMYVGGSSEEEIREQLKRFLASYKVRNFTASDFQAFAKYLAKGVSLQEKKSGFITEKMHVAPVKFAGPNGVESVPFFILRREGHSALRIGVACPKGFIALITAWDRTDHSYDDQRKKYSFGEMQLPTLSQPIPRNPNSGKETA